MTPVTAASPSATAAVAVNFRLVDARQRSVTDQTNLSVNDVLGTPPVCEQRVPLRFDRPGPDRITAASPTMGLNLVPLRSRC